MNGTRSPAIMLRDLRKSYGQVTALDGLSLAVRPGSITGLLGPNGSGKTTTVSILSTALRPDGGQALVAGLDVTTHAGRGPPPDRLRRRSSPPWTRDLTGRENLRLIGRLSRLPRPVARERSRRGSRAVRAGRGRRPAGPRLLGWHAAAPRCGGRAHAPPTGAVSRRADDRPGSGEPHAAVAAGRRAGRGRDDGVADHAVPGGGRRPGRPRGDSSIRAGWWARAPRASSGSGIGSAVVALEFADEHAAVRAQRQLGAQFPAAQRNGPIVRLASEAGSSSVVGAARALTGADDPVAVQIREPYLDDVFLALTSSAARTSQQGDAA